MAIMIPSEAREHKENSLEGVMFKALEELLPNDYYVVHSFKNVYVEDNVLYEGETDFLVFNPNYGVICLEAKAGQVKYEGNRWLYGNGHEMKHGGPYNQAANNKWNLMERIKLSPLADITKRCKFLHAVWFPSISKSDLYSNRFPAECNREITLTKESLSNPEEDLLRIFNLQLPNNAQTNLSQDDVKRLLREIICPECNVFPTSTFDIDLKKATFHRLLKEQYGLLNYLSDQRTAVISGAAGTGKTMIAVEKAMRHASHGDKVLFLCYNAALRDDLEKKHSHDNIDFLTIDGFACKLCGTGKADYENANEKIMDMFFAGTFPYVHVIVDEGQDFGSEKIEEADILQTIHDTVVEDFNSKGTFYVFYDKLQLIQSKHIPKYIADADCKLTLYRNCRNTENIATTSLKPISDRNPILPDGAVKGTPAKMFFCDSKENAIENLNAALDGLRESGLDDVVILTCETEEKSIISGLAKDGKYKKKKFTTCRKFKGLEADAVILIDVSEHTFDDDNVMRFYVGASRARVQLDIITNLDDEACTNILQNKLNYAKKIKVPKKNLALALNAMPAMF